MRLSRTNLLAFTADCLLGVGGCLVLHPALWPHLGFVAWRERPSFGKRWCAGERWGMLRFPLVLGSTCLWDEPRMWERTGVGWGEVRYRESGLECWH